METIIINNIEYYKGDDLFIHTPIFCKKSRTARELIKHKNIENTIYAKNINGEWIKTDGNSKKFDKILIPKNFCNTIPELNNENNKIIIDDNGIEKAPEIICLNDNEKFKDENGNILEIETRGERKVNGLFFKVIDVENAFNINYLNDVLNYKLGTYNYKIDYIYFMCKKNNSLEKIKDRVFIKKTMFLTFNGFLKLIHSTLHLSSDTRLTSTKWLYDNFYSKKEKEYIINISKDIEKSKIGYVYCITSKTVNHIKIGFWTGCLTSLKQRYATYYGSDTYLFSVKTLNARELEKKCHHKFKHYQITNELFIKKHFDEYEQYLKQHKIKNYFNQ